MSDGALIFWLIVIVLVYFLPWFAAANKEGEWGVFVVNLFLGWTLIGWVVALAWAVSLKRKKEAPAGQPSAIMPTARVCPFCAEAIQPAAIVCKHCRRDVPAIAQAAESPIARPPDVEPPAAPIP